MGKFNFDQFGCDECIHKYTVNSDNLCSICGMCFRYYSLQCGHQICDLCCIEFKGYCYICKKIGNPVIKLLNGSGKVKIKQ